MSARSTLIRAGSRPVHLYAQTADVRPMRALAERHGLQVLEDAARAHGARAHGTPAGALGHAAASSFYPTKNLGAFGDGGAVTMNDAGIADHVRVLRNYGSRLKSLNEVQGVNSRLDELQAAALGAKLPHLDAWNARRARRADRYLAALTGARSCCPTCRSGQHPPDICSPSAPPHATACNSSSPIAASRRSFTTRSRHTVRRLTPRSGSLRTPCRCRAHGARPSASPSVPT